MDVDVDVDVEKIKSAVVEMVEKESLAGYCVGITMQKGRGRARQYNAVGIPHYKILFQGLSSYDALYLEKQIFTYLVGDRKFNNYLKYKVDSRDKPYRPSKGNKGHTYEKKYHFYMAWWEKEETPATARRRAAFFARRGY